MTPAKLRTAALDVFLAKGLDAPLEEIARAAGVSIGILYNRFGSREGLIDAVIPDVAGTRLQALGATVLAQPTPRQRLKTFIHGMIDLQQADPALNDAILRRYPDAVALLGIYDISTALGKDLIREAHTDGSLTGLHQRRHPGPRLARWHRLATNSHPRPGGRLDLRH